MHIIQGVLNSQGGGAPYVPPQPENPDPYWEFVTSYLKFEGPDGSTSVVDEKGLTWTAHGGAAISTVDPIDGSGSLDTEKLSATPGYLQCLADDNFNPGAQDFCAEAWIRQPSALRNGYFYSRYSRDDGRTWAIYSSTSTQGFLSALVSFNGTSAIQITNDPAVAYGRRAYAEPDQDDHVALVRDGGQFRIYLNGVLYGFYNHGVPGEALFDGGAPGLLNASVYNAAIASESRTIYDNARFTLGVPRYTGNYVYPWRADGPVSDRTQTVIALVSSSSVHAAPINTKKALVAAGYTEANIISVPDSDASLPTCDVVVICRGIETQTEYDTLIAPAWGGGTPVVFCMFGAGAVNAVSMDGPSTFAGLTGQVYPLGANEAGVCRTTAASHFITDHIRPEVDYYWYTDGDTYMGGLTNNNELVGTALSHWTGTDAVARVDLIAVEAGTSRLNAMGASPARAVVAGQCYGGQRDYMPRAYEVLARSIEWCLGYEY